ncbi:unnamed protein product [Calicophoron daubneyi]|uniref:Uncharacterized protein n=1 Tax=Calicophoron daubneyi TaxID=300641 RepID=A0AAV2TEA5_CALDB
MFFTTSSCSSSEDEGVWPPPGRRRRHPAGNFINSESVSSIDSQSCISKLLDSPEGVAFCDERWLNDTYPGGVERNTNLWNKGDIYSQATQSSSGFHSQARMQSCTGLDSPFFPLYNQDHDDNPTSTNLALRIEQCSLNDSPSDLPNIPSTPPMLRRFLDSQSSTYDDCSFSCPPSRFMCRYDERIQR